LGTGIYQITNNSNFALNNIGLRNLQTGVTSVANAGLQYCNFPLTMQPGFSCLLKLSINSAQTAAAVNGGPQACYTVAKPVYCSQALDVDQLAAQITPGPVADNCQANIANFNYELSQNFDSSAAPDPVWGPSRNVLALSPANPNLSSCMVSAGITWSQQRILAAAAFWVSQKLNYCHHYTPDYYSPANTRGAALNAGGYCNPVVDLMPGTPYFNQEARWNYSGQGSQTIANWQNNNYMWFGFDCSNYTAWLYDFAFGIVFDSGTGFQAGQRSNGSQDLLSPNQQSVGNTLDNPNAAGTLVCADNTLEVAHSCAGHGNYLSVINSSGTKVPSLVTPSQLAALHPGDLLYIADSDIQKNPTNSEVTHVVMWTGKTIGNGPNQIPASQIAPEDLCPQSDWMPVAGQYVITDSHYQGADYRMITSCFYLNNLWGVRRVIT
jgi:hypothetical protein